MQNRNKLEIKKSLSTKLPTEERSTELSVGKMSHNKSATQFIQIKV